MPLPETLLARVRPPILLLMGSPRPVAEWAQTLHAVGPLHFYQMDLHQAQRLREELAQRGLSGEVVCHADVWDLPAIFQTVIFPTQAQGERELKLDLLEQAYHVLQPKGLMITVSEYAKDTMFARWHKKIFGQCSESPASKEGMVFWSVRQADQPRRRHEMRFHARIGEHPSLEFVSRPGVFCYGRFDDGSRALLECSQIEAGQRVLDLGCGVGANGILAWQRTGPGGHITFVDSNLRAVRLTELNAQANGLSDYRVLADATLQTVPTNDFDVVLANPPYYASSSIAQRFIELAVRALKPSGRLFLVTKTPQAIGEMLAQHFEQLTAQERRGYVVFAASRGTPP